MFTIDGVKNAIANLKKNKAPGSDGIYPEMIIYAGDVLVDRLTKLFNMCLVHGFVPDSFGQSVIVPVLKDKNGNAGCYNNYRQISLTTIFSKVFELYV